MTTRHDGTLPTEWPRSPASDTSHGASRANRATVREASLKPFHTYSRVLPSQDEPLRN